MISRKILCASLIVMVALTGCVPGGSTPATATMPAATTAAPATPTVAPTEVPTEAPSATAPPATNTVESTAIPPTEPAATETATGGLPPDDYRDDRSNAVAVLESYVNALNRKEYARAYGYWEENGEVEPFADFAAGFAETEAVTLETGALGGEGAAGNLFYTVPATLHATHSDGNTQTFVGCYTLHVSQPAVQATPPFRPLGIRSATLTEAAAGADTAALMAATCPPAVPLTPEPTPPAGEVGAAYYIDDRSDPAAVLRSLFNALNRHEYLRAYSYWKEGSDVGSFADFEAGYADTATVELETGEPTGDAGAGQFNYLVPVTLRVETTGGETQTFVGCYALHLSNPGIQVDPPFVPLGIRAADVQPVAAGADPAALMANACATPPQ
jgi:hypothetical protein